MFEDALCLYQKVVILYFKHIVGTKINHTRYLVKNVCIFHVWFPTRMTYPQKTVGTKYMHKRWIHTFYRYWYMWSSRLGVRCGKKFTVTKPRPTADCSAGKEDLHTYWTKFIPRIIQINSHLIRRSVILFVTTAPTKDFLRNADKKEADSSQNKK